MAEQILGGNTGPPELEDGGLVLEPEREAPLVSKEVQGRPTPGSRLPERALRMTREGQGPQVMTGRKVTRLLDTAGRKAQLTHGQTGPDMTSGQQQRQQLMGARAARSDPRDAMHYREDFGVAMTTPTHQKVVQQQKDFSDYVSTTQQQLTSAEQQVAADRQNVAREAANQRSFLDSEYQKAMNALPKKQSISDAYNKWYNSGANHEVRIWSGNHPNSPGKYEAKYRVPGQNLGKAFEELVKSGAAIVHNNNVYVKGRGQEIHDLFRDAEHSSKANFYTANAPAIAEANKQIDAARSAYTSQYNQGLNLLQKEVSDANVRLSQMEGTIQGRRQGLGREVEANKEDLAQVRKSYNDRINRIDEALNATLAKRTGSRSEAQPPRQINPQMPGARA